MDARAKDGPRRNQLGVGVFHVAGRAAYREGAGVLRADGGDCQGGSEMLVARCDTARHGMRYDGETETFVTHSLRADGFDASEDGTGCGTPIIPIQSVQAVRDKKQNGIGIGDAGDEMFTLTGRDRHAIAFNLRGREGGSQPEPDHLANIRAASGGSSRSYVAFAENQRGEVTTSETLGALKVGGGKPGQSYPAISICLGSDPIYNSELAMPQTARNCDPGVVQKGTMVRRLTPRECERLQGFEDDYTLVPYRGKLAADGPRYKALGNSFAVPVVRWIGERIQMVEMEVAA